MTKCSHATFIPEKCVTTNVVCQHRKRYRSLKIMCNNVVHLKKKLLCRHYNLETSIIQKLERIANSLQMLVSKLIDLFKPFNLLVINEETITLFHWMIECTV